MNDTAQSQGTVSLLAQLASSIPELVRKEVQLLRAEMSEKGQEVGVAIGLIVGGAIMAITALNVLAAALVSAIAETGLAPGWAALIVGGIIAICAFALMAKGENNLKTARLAPTRTMRSVGKDAAVIRETTK
jgi:hypothetical protein